MNAKSSSEDDITITFNGNTINCSPRELLLAKVVSRQTVIEMKDFLYTNCPTVKWIKASRERLYKTIIKIAIPSLILGAIGGSGFDKILELIKAVVTS